jgi:putative spermidine/putrescine transport system permease protein
MKPAVASATPTGDLVSLSRRARPDRRWLALVPLLAVLGFAFIWPLVNLVIDSFHVEGQWSFANYADQLSSSVFWKAIYRSFEAAAITTVACVLIGYPMAYAMVRLPRRVASVLLLVALVPFFTSILIRSYAWIAILGSNGLIARLLEFLGMADPPRLVFNKFGMLVGMIQLNLPLAVLLIYSVMRGLTRTSVKAAQSLGATPALAFWHVYRPATMAGVSAAASLIFVSTLGFFVTPSVLGGPGQYLIAQAISTRFSNLLDFGGAAAQAALLLVIVLLLVALLFRQFARSLSLPGAESAQGSAQRGGPLRRAWRRLRHRAESGENEGGELAFRLQRGFDAVLRVLGRLRTPALWTIWIFGFMLLVTPLLVVTIWAFNDGRFLSFPPEAYSFRWFGDYFSNDLWVGSTVLSLWVSAAAGLLSVVVGGLAAFGLVRGPARGRLPVTALAVSPMVIPPMVLGLGFFFIVAPWGLVGTPLGLIIPYVVLGLPTSVLVIASAFRNLDMRLERAAASLGARPLLVTRWVIIPALIPSLGAAFVFAFLAGFDDVVIAMFMSGATAATLPIRMFQDISLEVSPRTAVVAVLLFALAAAVVTARWGIGALMRVLRRSSRAERLI